MPPVAEGKIKNIMELPNECLLEIMSYLSNYDVLRNVAGVSKKFHGLSQDPHLIRKIEVDSESWPISQEEEYCKGLLEVLKRSLKLTFLSFEFGRGTDDGTNHRVSGEKFLEGLPSMSHQFLREFCLKSNDRNGCTELGPLNSEHIVKYFEKCPNLKVFKHEFRPFLDLENEPFTPDISIWKKFDDLKHKNLQELHLIGVDITGFLQDVTGSDFDEKENALETIAKNFPNLQRLRLTCQYKYESRWWSAKTFFQKFASEKKIRLEISSVLKCTCGHAPWIEPCYENRQPMKIFGPK